MKVLRKVNRKLGATVGYEVRKVRKVEQPAVHDKPIETPEEPLAYRPPADPGLDRLLKRPIFIMSPVRSGSTLLRLILTSHSELHSPHELHFRRLEASCSTGLCKKAMEELGLDRGDLEHLLWDRVMHRELVRSGKSTIVEKTPSNTFVWRRIAACWPDARFIFLLRHPMSIAVSWHEADTVKRTYEEATADALRYMNATQRARKALPGHTVRYEDLTAEPESTVKDLCGFLEVDWEPEMLQYGPRGEGELQKGLGDWKDKIASGVIQSGRELPDPAAVPKSLQKICKAWGYPVER
ncbi:MAG: sulfotransferase [Actinophytocola sp.]|nr:sulfotransferase [Actinophytocola sp.]